MQINLNARNTSVSISARPHLCSLSYDVGGICLHISCPKYGQQTELIPHIAGPAFSKWRLSQDGELFVTCVYNFAHV